MTAVVAGAGTDVLLVHGALGDYRQWAGIAADLRARHTVVAISRRYHWPNPAPEKDAEYSYERHRDELLEYIDARGAPVHLVGHSYGAGIALLAAIAKPGAIRTLTVIEPAFHSLLPDGHPELPGEIASRASMRSTVQMLVNQGDDESATRAMIDWTQGGPGGFTLLPPDAQHVLLQNAASVGPTFSRPAPEVTPQQVSTLPMPTLVLRGARTRLYYRLIAETVASAVPNARRAQVPDAGHMSIVERPEAVGALLQPFLDGR